MRKRAKVCVGLFLCLSLITGCGNSSELKLSDVKKDTLYISEDNSIELINVEDFDKDYYKESDLKLLLRIPLIHIQKIMMVRSNWKIFR